MYRPSISTSNKCANTRNQRGRMRQGFDGVSPNTHRLYFAEYRRATRYPCDQQYRRRPGILVHRSSDDQKTRWRTRERRHPSIAKVPSAKAPAHCRADLQQATDLGHLLCAGFLHGMSHRKKYADLVSECMVIVAASPRGATGPPMPTRRLSPILDGGIGEHALDVFLPRQKQRCHHHRGAAEAHHQIARKVCAQRTVHHSLLRITAQTRVQQQPGTG